MSLSWTRYLNFIDNTACWCAWTQKWYFCFRSTQGVKDYLIFCFLFPQPVKLLSQFRLRISKRLDLFCEKLKSRFWFHLWLLMTSLQVLKLFSGRIQLLPQNVTLFGNWLFRCSSLNYFILIFSPCQFSVTKNWITRLYVQVGTNYTCLAFNLNSISMHVRLSSSISHCIWVFLSLSIKISCSKFSFPFFLLDLSSVSKSFTCNRQRHNHWQNVKGNSRQFRAHVTFQNRKQCKKPLHSRLERNNIPD